MDTMEIVGLVIVITHVIVMGAFILWFGLGSPRTMAEFRAKFKEQMLGGKKRGPELSPKR
jgi:hypothetical protein